jgi:hypothetical protein
LIVKIVLGALAYAGTLLTFHRSRIATLRGIVPLVRDQRLPAVSTSPEAATDIPLGEPVGAV